jgi:hypothetical protein
MFIDKFSRHWLDTYSFNIFGVNRPRIQKNVFEGMLSKYREKLEKYSVIELLDVFSNINRNISMLPRGKQFGKSSRPSKKILNEAMEKNFYLGLDKNLDWFINLT